MKETTQQQLREAFYDRQIMRGNPIKMEQIFVCQHCEHAYKLDFAKGTSRTCCSEWACKLAARGDQVAEKRHLNNLRYKVARQKQDWKHDTSREDARARRQLVEAQGFTYA